MRCIFCGHEHTRVTNKRDVEDAIRRRRECLKCKGRFTTYERAYKKDLIVVKKDKRREPFNREKLLLGIIKACEKRPISHEKINKIISNIEKKLRKKSKGREIKSKIIGELVMNALKKLDPVAYIRFASVYREFKDVEDFKKEIKEVKNKRKESIKKQKKNKRRR